MSRTPFHKHVVTACILLCIVALSSAATPSGPRPPVPPLEPVTVDTLTNLRASSRVEKVDYQLMETPVGVGPISDGLSTQGSAVSAIYEAFHVPLCREWAYQEGTRADNDDSPRFPFAIETNERLVDALEKLKENSNGFLDWLLFHDRIVVTAGPAANAEEIYITLRPIRVQIEAQTLQEAFEQLEAAYNQQYSDAPLCVRPIVPQSARRGPSQDSAHSGKFVLKAEGSLRQIVLQLLDKTKDVGVCYEICQCFDREGRRYFALHVMKKDDPNRDVFENAEDVRESRSVMESSIQRREEYFERVEKAAAGETQP